MDRNSTFLNVIILRNDLLIFGVVPIILEIQFVFGVVFLVSIVILESGECATFHLQALPVAFVSTVEVIMD